MSPLRRGTAAERSDRQGVAHKPCSRKFKLRHYRKYVAIAGHYRRAILAGYENHFLTRPSGGFHSSVDHCDSVDRNRSAVTAQGAEVQVDPNWPQIPNNWVLGEVTSISVDRNDRIWVLHVPQSIPEAQRANAAPPVLQFDAAGKLLASWGGPRRGPVWPGREHGIFVDSNDFIWIGGRAGWPRRPRPASATT